MVLYREIRTEEKVLHHYDRLIETIHEGEEEEDVEGQGVSSPVRRPGPS
jgi:hypothetical protein